MATLRDSLTIRSVTLPNRIWFPPVARDLAQPDGMATDDNVEAYRKVAAGGVGTVVVEHCFVHVDGRFSDKQLGIDRDDCVEGLARIASAIRACGAVPIVQTSFAGARTYVGRKLGPSPVPMPGESEAPEEISEDEIAGIPSLFERAARRAREAGFSGIEVHAAHGFLLSEFLSPLTNRRTDGWGGSLRSRAHLLMEVVEAAKKHAAPDFLLSVRLGADDGLAGGMAPQDAALVGRWLAEAGVDVLSISGGLCGSRPAQFAGVQGYFFPQAVLVKSNVTIPVVAVGGVTEPAVAKAAVEQGKIDLVGVGRRLLTDPDWARRALAA